MFDKSKCRVVEKFDDLGRLEERIWKSMHSDAPHRQNGPAFEKFDPESGKLISSIWIDQRNGGYHRGDGLPALVQIDPVTGVVHNEEFYLSGIRDRPDGGPTKILRNRKSGLLVEQEFRVDGWLHRDDDLPAVMTYHEGSKQAARIEYHQGGVLHRDKGAAIVEFDETGNAILTRYFQRGKEMTNRVPVLGPSC